MQVFSTIELFTFGRIILWGVCVCVWGGAYLCIVECLEASLASTQLIPVVPF